MPRITATKRAGKVSLSAGFNDVYFMEQGEKSALKSDEYHLTTDIDNSVTINSIDKFADFFRIHVSNDIDITYSAQSYT